MTQDFKATHTKRGDHEAKQIHDHIAALRETAANDPDAAKRLQAQLMLERLS